MRCRETKYEEGAAYTNRRSEQRVALPVSAKDEGAANTDWKREQRAALPEREFKR